MSLATWKKEFYPVPADKVSKKNALAHSIRKWEGLTKENLERHGVVCEFCDVHELGRVRGFSIYASSCALCFHHLKVNKCVVCPLALSRGNVPCVRKRGTERISPFDALQFNNNPTPMIQALRKAEKFVQIQAAKGKR